MLKKGIARLLAVLMALSLAACGGEGGEGTTAPTTQPAAPTTQPTQTTAPSGGETAGTETAPTGTTAPAETTEPAPESMDTILDKLYAQHGWDGLFTLETIPDETVQEAPKYFTGLDDLSEVTDIAVSTPLIGSIAYTLILARVADPANAQTVAQKMHDGIDPRKWICVEADDMLVSGAGDVVMLIMVSSDQAENGLTAQSITDAFAAVCGPLDFTI